MIKVIELFAGVGAQRQALKQAGIEHEVVAISEIDKYAEKAYELLHGETRNLGDIRKIQELPNADLWTYSFPCTDISLSRQYQYELGVAIEEKNRYHRCLDAVWPLFYQVAAYDSRASLSIVIRFGHPSKIKTRRGVASAIEGVLLGSHTTRDGLIEDVIEYAKTHNSGCASDSYLAQETVEMAKRVRREKERLREVLERMLETAAKLPGFQLLESIPGIKDTSAQRLIAEIGDISKYNDAKAFVAYIGLDPMVLQSGKNTGEHLHITKKGNRFLRCTLYLCVISILTNY
jgi:hypothetical protein